MSTARAFCLLGAVGVQKMQGWVPEKPHNENLPRPGIHLNSIIHSHSGHPAYFFTIAYKRDHFPFFPRYLAIDEKILEFFRTAHAKRAKSVPGSWEPQLERSFELV